MSESDDVYLSPEISTSSYWNIYPETVLLSINTHSGINGTEDMYQFIESKQNTKIVLVNATAIGVCNYSDISAVQEKNELLLEEFNKFDKTKGIESFAKSVIPTMKEIDYYNTFRPKSKRSEKKSPDTKEYLHSFSKGHNLRVIQNGDFLFNKSYSISHTENEQRKQNPESSTDSIKILNVPGIHNDLFDIINTNSNLPRLKLKEIIEHLNRNGAKNIVIFDFSCNDFNTKQSDRYRRATRRRLTNDLGVQMVFKKRRKYVNNSRKNRELFEKNKHPKPSKTKRSFERIKGKKQSNRRNSV